MSAKLAVRPLASWDPFSLRLDRELLVLFASRLVHRQAPQVDGLTLEGEGERLLVGIRVRLAGIPASLRLGIEEIRMRGGILGFCLQQVRGPLGLGVPRFLVDLVAKRLPFPVEFDRHSGVVVVDLRGRLPLGLELEVRGVRLSGGTLEVALGPGCVAPPAPADVEDPRQSEPPASV